MTLAVTVPYVKSLTHYRFQWNRVTRIVNSKIVKKQLLMLCSILPVSCTLWSTINGKDHKR